MYYVITEILHEIYRTVAAWLDERPRVAQGLGAAAGVIAVWLVYLVGSALMAGPAPDAIAYQKVAGTVLYEDGSVIPGPSLMLELTPALDRSKTKGERPAAFVVDGQTGRFSGVMTYLEANKARTMPYKAVLRTAEQAALPAEIVPAAYGDFAATPARVNARDRRLEIRIRKPM